MNKEAWNKMLNEMAPENLRELARMANEAAARAEQRIALRKNLDALLEQAENAGYRFICTTTTGAVDLNLSNYLSMITLEPIFDNS